jgi:hypothetical protein
MGVAGTESSRYSMPSTPGFRKREIFNDEVAIVPRERATTSAARYHAISGFWTDLGLDDAVGGIGNSGIGKTAYVLPCDATRCPLA